jgi:hypothetical protein
MLLKNVFYENSYYHFNTKHQKQTSNMRTNIRFYYKKPTIQLVDLLKLASFYCFWLHFYSKPETSC